MSKQAEIVLFLDIMLIAWISYVFGENTPENTKYMNTEELEKMGYTVPDINMKDVNFDPEEMGHINLASMKPGQCPELACPLIKGEKPCPHAKGEKIIFHWQGMQCPACPRKWNPKSCDDTPLSDDNDSDDVECPKLSCPQIKAKKPCEDALPVVNRVMWRGKECRGCPTKWNPDSCDPEKRKNMDIREQELILETDEHVKSEL